MNDEPNKNVFLAILVGATIVIIVLGLGVYFFDKSIVDRSSTQLSAINTDITSSWSVYDNKRYDFTLKEPANFEKIESANDDGITFNDNNIATIRVYALSNSQGETTEKYLSREFNNILLTNLKVAKNITTNEALGDCVSEGRLWQYTTNDNKDKTIEKIVCMKNNIFYVAELEVPTSNVEQYKTVFDAVKKSVDIK